MRSLLAAVVVVFAAVPAHAGSGIKVTLGATTGSGATETYRFAVVKKVERSYLGAIKRCYQAALKKRPDLEGKLSIGFTVDKKGAMSQLKTGFDPTIDPCILKAAKSWKFGVPKDDAKAAVDATFIVELMLIAPEQETGSSYATMLSAEGGSPPGDMSKRRPGADLGQQINDVRDGGATVKVGGAGTSPGAKVPAGRISIADKKAFDATNLSVDSVLKKIQMAYFAGLKRCYKSRLNADATLRGKMILAFTVNEAGRSISATARGFDPELDKCVTAMMGNWTFPVPKDGDGEATEAGFQISLALVPD